MIERGDRGAVGALAQRHAAFDVAHRAHVGDARRGAVEILARHQVREAARAHLRRVAARYAPSCSSSVAPLVLVNGSRAGRHQAHVGGQHQQAHLLAEDAFDDVEPRQHGGGGVGGFRGLRKSLSPISEISIWRVTAGVPTRRVELARPRPGTGRARAMLVRAHRVVVERAEVARQHVARVGEPVDHGLVGRGVERRGQRTARCAS